jgi:hypothetical protein
MMPPPGPQPQQPMMPRMAPPQGAGGGGMDPATTMAVRGALMGKGIPSAYGQLTNRAIGGAIAGPGGPPMPPGAGGGP